MQWILGAYAIASLVTFFIYGHDKRQARRGGSRVPEKMLHACEFVGGWGGALVAQRVWHHKTKKRSYQLIFWTIGVLHAAMWCGWAYWRFGAPPT